jgi:hypothetical protein
MTVLAANGATELGFRDRTGSHRPTPPDLAQASLPAENEKLER